MIVIRRLMGSVGLECSSPDRQTGSRDGVVSCGSSEPAGQFDFTQCRLPKFAAIMGWARGAIRQLGTGSEVVNDVNWFLPDGLKGAAALPHGRRRRAVR